jgi:hypothetical protein
MLRRWLEDMVDPVLWCEPPYDRSSDGSARLVARAPALMQLARADAGRQLAELQALAGGGGGNGLPAEHGARSSFSALLVLPATTSPSERLPLLPLLLRAIASRSLALVVVACVANHALNHCLLSLVWPLSLFLYALLESPRPDSNFFRIATWCALSAAAVLSVAAVAVLPLMLWLCCCWLLWLCCCWLLWLPCTGCCSSPQFRGCAHPHAPCRC